MPLDTAPQRQKIKNKKKIGKKKRENQQRGLVRGEAVEGGRIEQHIHFAYFDVGVSGECVCDGL